MKKAVLFLSAFVFLISCAGSNIHLAAKQNNIDRVKYFVSKGDVNQYDGVANIQPGSATYMENKDRHLGYTPLMVACYYGYAEIADYLCRSGADVNAQNEDGEFSLLFAAQYNYPQITTILIQHGVSVNMKDRKGHTALYYAEQAQYLQIAEQLKAVAAVAE